MLSGISFSYWEIDYTFVDIWWWDEWGWDGDGDGDGPHDDEDEWFVEEHAWVKMVGFFLLS